MVLQSEKLNQLVEKNNGMIQLAQALSIGISKPTFYDYIAKEGLDRVAHGIYARKDAWVDDMYLLHLRCNQAVFSHESALLLHDLTDREPSSYSLTVKAGYNPTSLKKDGFKVYNIKEELYGLGKITAITTFGNTVPVYNMERTICDIIRNRSKIEMQTFQDALKQYARRPDKDLRTLIKYAQSFKVENILRRYLEVLL